MDPNMQQIEYNEEQMEAFVCEYIERSLPTERVSVEQATTWTAGLYRMMSIPQPEVKLFDGPSDAWDWMCSEAGEEMEFLFPPYTGVMQIGLVAAAEFLMENYGAKKPKDFDNFKPCTNLTMIWPLDDVCVCTQPPLGYKFNEDNMLHCEDGPVVWYADGTAIWAIEGIDVDEQIVMNPQSQTIQQIQEESNTDVRSIRIDRYGWLKYLTETGAVCLEEGPNDVEGTYEALFSTDQGNRFVGTCNTGPIVTLHIPGEIRTLQEARWFLQQGDREMNIVGRT